MKTPTLEEVKEYFKNAKEVRSADLPHHYNDIFDISDRSIFEERQIHFHINAYWLCKKEISNIMLWSSKNGYAEIISYIEPTTKVRNSVLLQLAENNIYSEEILKKECPKLFENKLEVGKWYKNTKQNQNIIFVQNVLENDVTCFGFNFIGEWMESMSRRNNAFFTLATPQEVETALIQEFEKQSGFKYQQYKFEDNTLKGKYNCWVLWTDLFKDGKFLPPTEIITIFEKYGKDKIQEYLNNVK